MFLSPKGCKSVISSNIGNAGLALEAVCIAEALLAENMPVDCGNVVVPWKHRLAALTTLQDPKWSDKAAIAAEQLLGPRVPASVATQGSNWRQPAIEKLSSLQASRCTYNDVDLPSSRPPYHSAT